MMSKAEMAASILQKSQYLAKKLVKEFDENVNYCTICYTNEIKTDGDQATSTIMFECGHAFCTQCTLSQLSQLIGSAELDKIKCFEFDCPKANISESKLKDILTHQLEEKDLWAKFERFRDKKELDKDPLVRYCTKAGCDGYMRGKSLEKTQKLQCPKCNTWVCFLCREEWHGEGVSCDALLDKQL